MRVTIIGHIRTLDDNYDISRSRIAAATFEVELKWVPLMRDAGTVTGTKPDNIHEIRFEDETGDRRYQINCP